MLPHRVRQLLGEAMGRLAFALGIRRRVTLSNLALAFPDRDPAEWERIAREAYVNMAHAGLEALTSTRIEEGRADDYLKIENWEPFQRALSLGRGVLVATAHFGSWELLGEILARRGLPLNAVVRPLKGALNARIIQSRLDAGLKLISPRGAINGTVQALRRGEVVAILLDQALPGGRGLEVPFFGQPASTSPALSAAALRTGAPAFVAMAVRSAQGLQLYLEGPVPMPQAGSPSQAIEEHTAALTSIIERFVRLYPEQWLWLHRRWKVGSQDFRKRRRRRNGRSLVWVHRLIYGFSVSDPTEESNYPTLEGLVESIDETEVENTFGALRQHLLALKGPRQAQAKRVEKALEQCQALITHLLEVRKRLEQEENP
jgi:KDO2-lipid IV(A) lauroyltransferase